MSLVERLSAYLERLWSRPVRVEDLSRIPGGASRETYRFDAVFDDGERRGLILRRDPTGSLIDTDRATEFLAYQSFYGVVPVPEPVALEIDPGPLERPFFIMGRVDGGVGRIAPSAPIPTARMPTAVGCKSLFAILGRIARADPAGLPIARAPSTPRLSMNAGDGSLMPGRAVLLRDERHSQPIAHAALRRLRRNPPPPAQKLSVVHGDYRSGNFLHAEGKVIAILDWEMAHLGDPIRRPSLVPRPHVEPFRRKHARQEPCRWRRRSPIWERESGLQADPKALHWWGLFNSRSRVRRSGPPRVRSSSPVAGAVTSCSASRAPTPRGGTTRSSPSNWNGWCVQEGWA